MTKYHANAITVLGQSFDSKTEGEFYLYLLAKQQAGEITEIKLQPSFELQPRFQKDGHTIRPIIYIADFEVTHADGTIEVIDVKGFETADFKIKKKLFDYRYPDLKLTRMKKVVKFGGWITHEEWLKQRRRQKSESLGEKQRSTTNRKHAPAHRQRRQTSRRTV